MTTKKDQRGTQKESRARAQTPKIEADTPEQTDINMSEIISILVRKQRTKIRSPITKLNEEVRETERLVKLWKNYMEIRVKQEELSLKRILIEKSDTPDILRLQQNILNISSEDLRKQLGQEDKERMQKSNSSKLAKEPTVQEAVTVELQDDQSKD